MIGVLAGTFHRVSACQTLHRSFVYSLWRSSISVALNAIFPIGHAMSWQVARKSVKKALPERHVASRR